MKHVCPADFLGNILKNVFKTLSLLQTLLEKKAISTSFQSTVLRNVTYIVVRTYMSFDIL